MHHGLHSRGARICAWNIQCWECYAAARATLNPTFLCCCGCSWQVISFAGQRQWQTSLAWPQVAAPGVITPDLELVVRGEGMPRAGGAGRGNRGDLRVRFKVAFPQRLSPLQLAQLQAVLG